LWQLLFLENRVAKTDEPKANHASDGWIEGDTVSLQQEARRPNCEALSPAYGLIASAKL